MVFYVKPPGEVRLLDMIDGGFNRLKFLLGLKEEKRGNYVPVNVNYLIENSELDKVSHFTLRLLCMYSKEFSRFFVNAETQFFEYRIEGIEESTAFEALQSFKKELELTVNDRENELREFHMCAIGICNFLENEILLRHVFHETHEKNCHTYTVKVPFRYCTELVRNREVELRDGFCNVHCGAWKALLRCIFSFRLKYLVENIKRFINMRGVEFQERIDLFIRPLLDTFQRIVETKEYLEKGNLLSSQVDQESELFPPCAQNVLIHLRKNHRLKHQSRYQFTLFLKDIGMDVNEALVFWKDEYSQNFEGQSRSIERDLWSKKRSHYEYNIRHTYGKVGGCKQYSSFSCSKIQTENKTLESGCPFETMPKTELVKFLRGRLIGCNSKEITEIPPIEDILSHVSLRKPSEACMTFFNAHKKKVLSKKGITSSNTKENVSDITVIHHSAVCGEENVKVNQELGIDYHSISNDKCVSTPRKFGDIEIDKMHKVNAESTGNSESNKYSGKRSDGRHNDLDFELCNPIQYYFKLKKLL